MPPKASRNKTIRLEKKQISSLVSSAIKLKNKSSFDKVENKIIWQDSLQAIDKLPDKCVDLMIVDPPYNLTKNFGSSTFHEMSNDDYAKWLDKWLKKTVRVLKDNASVYICADWKTSIAIPYIAGKYFILQNRISWERE
ncbi:MAG: site-specific DNA-methyltransferase, partial [Alphaproteobacteria bacterium]|nr:site-specific DNA-methyltransferase [Alphaproteobacteria bacterium]